MQKSIIILTLIAFTSCIPTKIAPRFKNQDYKVMLAKKFQRKLPRETSFIFKDPKNAYDFYNYINKKYSLNHSDVGLNTPFQLDGETYYLSYREINKDDSNFNLIGLIVDAKLDEENLPTVFNNYTSRKGHWYIVLTVYDEEVKNCLLNKHPVKPKVIQYLKNLKQEYLNTQNYEELLFTKNPD